VGGHQVLCFTLTSPSFHCHWKKEQHTLITNLVLKKSFWKSLKSTYINILLIYSFFALVKNSSFFSSRDSLFPSHTSLWLARGDLMVERGLPPRRIRLKMLILFNSGEVRNCPSTRTLYILFTNHPPFTRLFSNPGLYNFYSPSFNLLPPHSQGQVSRLFCGR